MAWNWCVHISKYCELYIITEGEFYSELECKIQKLPQGKNMHFYYNFVPNEIRKMCWNQGDWRFYKYYKRWQKKTANIAREICQYEKIDVLHQLNMIGFREPGYLWKVSQETGIPFVWGPIGGLKQFPMPYAKGGGLKIKCFLWAKNFLNIIQLKYSRRVNSAIEQGLLISSIPDSYRAIKKYKGKESVVIPETGTFVHSDISAESNRFFNDNLTLLWVGKFDFRKRLDLAIAAVALAKEGKTNLVLKIFGTGNAAQQQKAKETVQSLGLEDIVQWMGNCPNTQVVEEMRKADLFIFTSVSEDTSTVVLEAISNHLPVLCFDTCGMSSVITEQVGVKIPLTNPQQSINDFAEKIKFLNNNRNLLEEMSNNCKQRAEELSWANKAKKIVKLYQKVINRVVQVSP